MIKTILAALLLPLSLFAEDVTPAQAEVLLAKKEAPVVIDIRTPEEYKEGHLKGAKLVNFRKDFEKELAKLDRDKAYLMHCKSGGRSTKSLVLWKKLGFKKVYHLQSGYDGWVKAGKPVVKK